MKAITLIRNGVIAPSLPCHTFFHGCFSEEKNIKALIIGPKKREAFGKYRKRNPSLS
ncbi:hypothetical protein [Desulfovibrio sp. Huiquan2017]|uniref:hypothetical protein n=1 Tax=Desulfovibrio sp. Huiquan2017 TaxID=2816861 RepID=UPI001A913920|nr:hypothetical protein [Desulfovibrio sp. Huiquan2017]